MTKKSTKPESGDNRRRRRRDETCADWGNANSELLARVIELVTAGGGAIRFGYSRDGGAYSLGIYGDGKPYTEFQPGNTDIDGWLEELRIDFE